MSVYIEYVIIDNFVITFLIALISYRLLKAEIKKIRIVCGSLIATFVALLYPFMNFETIFLVLIKLALYIVLSLILFFKKPYFFKGSVIFLLVTAMTGGVMFMAGYFVYADIEKALTLPFYDFPVGVIISISLAIYFLLKRLVSFIIKHRNIQNFLYQIEFSALNKSITANAFLDSGNLLFDDKYGLPIVVISSPLVLKLLSDSQLESVLRNKGEGIDKSAHYIKFDTISKEGKLLLIKAQKFQLYLKDGTNIIKEVMLGLTLNRLAGGFDALLPSSLF